MTSILAFFPGHTVTTVVPVVNPVLKGINRVCVCVASAFSRCTVNNSTNNRQTFYFRNLHNTTTLSCFVAFLPYFCLSLSLKIPAQMCESASVSLSHQVKMMMVVVVGRMRMMSFHGDSDRLRCDYNLTFSLSLQEVRADK